MLTNQGLHINIPRDVVDQESPSRAPIIATSHRPMGYQEQMMPFNHQQNPESLLCVISHMSLPEALLSCRIPDLQFDCFSTNIDDPRTKFHADGVVRVLFD